MHRNPISRIVAALSAAVAFCAQPASAQSAADFYRGKTVTLLTSSGTGGGYDTLSRSIARHLPKHKC